MPGIARLKGITEPCIRFHGLTDIAYYGLHFRPLPRLDTVAALEAVNCEVAVSVSELYSPSSDVRVLLSREPDARIGYSVYVYDLRKHSQ